MPWAHRSRSPVFLFVFLAFVFGCNALLGWWVSSSVVAPLARLRDAAVRIGEGDLRFRMAPRGPGEFGQVTSAFEIMREKLETAVTRQLAEETSRKELIAHVSHDLRTPINLIRGYAEGLRDGVASTPEMRARYLDTILERAGELERLIELLFSYSTMDLEGVRPKLVAVEVAPYLRGLRDSLAAAFPRLPSVWRLRAMTGAGSFTRQALHESGRRVDPPRHDQPRGKLSQARRQAGHRHRMARLSRRAAWRSS